MTMQAFDNAVKLEPIPGIDAGLAAEAKQILANVGLPDAYSQRDDWAFEMLKSHPKAKEVVDAWVNSKENVQNVLSLSNSDENANLEECIKGQATLRFRKQAKPHTLPLGLATGLKEIHWDSHILIALEELNSENGLFDNLTMAPGEYIFFPTTRKLSLPAAGGGLAVLANLDLRKLPKKVDDLSRMG